MNTSSKEESSLSIIECINNISKLNIKNTKEVDVNILREMAQTAQHLAKQLYALYEKLSSESAEVQELSMLDPNTTINDMSILSSETSSNSNDSLSALLFVDEKKKESEILKGPNETKEENVFKISSTTSRIEKIVKIKDTESCRIKRLCSFRRSFLNKVFFKTDS
jgi:hypothetical protein